MKKLFILFICLQKINCNRQSFKTTLNTYYKFVPQFEIINKEFEENNRKFQESIKTTSNVDIINQNGKSEEFLECEKNSFGKI
jgi:hypothetical protein